MKYVSLFAGIGGFDLALNRLGHECVYVNEWDKYAAATYEKNFGHKPDTRSIRDVSIEEVPDHDILCGGFPCQAFSVAGRRGGFSDTRGTLFFEIARICKSKRPAYLLLENVKGLLSHGNGRTFSQSCGRLMNWGMTRNGRFLTARISESHRIGKECSLSDILEKNPDPKYFLSLEKQKQVLEGMSHLSTSNSKEQKSQSKQELSRQDITKDILHGMGRTQELFQEPYELSRTEQDLEL